MIQLVDFTSEYQALEAQINAAISEVLQSGYFIGGPKIEEFSTQFAQYMGADYVIPCANGTDALQIALMALGIGPGDEVIVPAFTFVAPAEAVRLLGASAVIVDVDPLSYNIDIAQLEQAISSKTKAIIPVHLFGQSANLEACMQLAQRHNLFVIEDNAQATGTTYRGKKTGTWGQFGCTSFFPTKNLGCYGDGGAVFTSDKELASRAKSIASHGQEGEKFYHPIVGINSRLDHIQAAILLEKLPLLDSYIHRRKEIANGYISQLNNIESIQTPQIVDGNDHSFHQFVVEIKDGSKEELRSFLRKKEIATGVYYPYAMNQLPAYPSKFACPVAERLAGNTIALPIHPYLKNHEVDYITGCIQEFYNG